MLVLVLEAFLLFLRRPPPLPGPRSPRRRDRRPRRRAAGITPDFLKAFLNFGKVSPEQIYDPNRLSDLHHNNSVESQQRESGRGLEMGAWSSGMPGSPTRRDSARFALRVREVTGSIPVVPLFFLSLRTCPTPTDDARGFFLVFGGRRRREGRFGPVSIEMCVLQDLSHAVEPACAARAPRKAGPQHPHDVLRRTAPADGVI